MAVNLDSPEKLLPIAGVELATVASQMRYTNRDDLLVMRLSDNASVAGVFTQNKFCAAPVYVAKVHLSHNPKYLVINAGNANAGTGEQGMQDAFKTCEALAKLEGCVPEHVLPFSTGVIGQHMDMSAMNTGLEEAVKAFDENAWLPAAHTIMTTDTVAKGISKQVQIDGKTVTITGIAKGSGMIKPDMATMLAFIATDGRLSRQLTQDLIHQGITQSFNAITVDSDTSTNDASMLIATNQVAHNELNESHADFTAFKTALFDVMQTLAHAIIRDGEGATKFVEVCVTGGQTIEDCREVAYTVAHSPLVKTALFASDPNWGRILMAVGKANIEELDVDKLTIHIGDVLLVENGGVANSYTESAGQAVFDQAEITITIDLKQGEAQASIWTTDFSYDYVKINAEYRS